VANKPVYVLAETYKFVRLFPLHQYDLPSSTSSSFELVESSLVPCDILSSNMTSRLDPKLIASSLNPMVDYTPPSYITLLFTDLGVLTPSGVSDELIKFYY
jgi:translation initiation factor eIF-2B subunit alpha